MTENANVSNISCEEAVELIAMLLDESAGDLERAALDDHLRTCRHCFNRLEFEQLLKSRLAGMKKDVRSPQLEEHIHRLLSAF